MQFLHTMFRVRDLDASLRFWVEGLGLREVRRRDSEKGRFTLVFLETTGDEPAQIELTYNWDQGDAYSVGRAFGHVAFAVDDIYTLCTHLQERGVTILRPPRDG
ncbi:MAG: VOC family protein, partial [Myxococcota bacterium]